MDVNAVGGSLVCMASMILLLGFVFLASAIRVVPEHKRLRVYRLGRDIGEKGPGVILLIPIIDRAINIDKGSPLQNGALKSLLIGTTGEAETVVQTNGTVVVNGQAWDATSDYPIAPKSKIRVKRVILEVEETSTS